MAKSGISGDRVSIIPHGVFSIYQKVHQREVRAGISAHEKVILCFGFIRHYKGLDVLIVALAQFPKELLQESRLLVAGAPIIDVSPFQRLAAHLEVKDRIIWDLRYIPDEEVGTYFAAATVVVFPYREIDQSGPLHIAIAFGKPIVATATGGFPNIVDDGVHGYLVPPEDPHALSLALQRVLSDKERAQDMSVAVRRLADTLSWDAISCKTAALYRSL